MNFEIKVKSNTFRPAPDWGLPLVELLAVLCVSYLDGSSTHPCC